jgi:hypothetical protein
MHNIIHNNTYILLSLNLPNVLTHWRSSTIPHYIIRHVGFTTTRYGVHRRRMMEARVIWNGIAWSVTIKNINYKDTASNTAIKWCIPIISICTDMFYRRIFVRKCINCYKTLCAKVIASAAINKQLTLYKRDVLIYFCTMARWIHDFQSRAIFFAVNLLFQKNLRQTAYF